MSLENLIQEYGGTGFTRYCEFVLNDFRNIKKVYPLLKIILLPTRNSSEIYITGKLISKKVLDLCSKPYQVEKLSLNILAIYPKGFPKVQMEVIDHQKKIKWSKIPLEHRHVNFWRGHEVICTHHPNGEINEIASEKRTTAILTTSWNLYTASNHYIRTGEWKLKELKHGDAAIPQLKRVGKYHK